MGDWDHTSWWERALVYAAIIVMLPFAIAQEIWRKLTGR